MLEGNFYISLGYFKHKSVGLKIIWKWVIATHNSLPHKFRYLLHSIRRSAINNVAHSTIDIPCHWIAIHLNRSIVLWTILANVVIDFIELSHLNKFLNKFWFLWEYNFIIKFSRYASVVAWFLVFANSWSIMNVDVPIEIFFIKWLPNLVLC